jgi:hypothetical protein
MEEFQRFNQITRCGTCLDNTEYGFFAIDWDYPDSEMMQAVTEWLAGKRKARAEAGLQSVKHKPISRGGYRDQLRWLGALRVRNFYPTNSMAEYTDSNLKVEAPFSHLPDLYEAAAKAENLIGQWFPAHKE